MDYTNKKDELYHHGIKGQKWGVRRFQNSDGSLTNAGKSRYGRGKEISKEHQRIEEKERIRLYKTDKEYNKAYNEAMRIAEKYGLDQDDGGGGDYTRWSEKELERAGQRYWNYSEDYSARAEILDQKAAEYAKKEILKKYGDTGVSDMNHYQYIKSAIGVGAFVSVFVGPMLLSVILN